VKPVVYQYANCPVEPHVRDVLPRVNNVSVHAWRWASAQAGRWRDVSDDEIRAAVRVESAPGLMNVLDLEAIPVLTDAWWTDARLERYIDLAMVAVDHLRRIRPGQRVGLWSVPRTEMVVNRAMAGGDASLVKRWRAWAARFGVHRNATGRFERVGLLDAVDCLLLDGYCPEPEMNCPLKDYVARMADEYRQLGKPLGITLWGRYHGPGTDYSRVMRLPDAEASARAVRDAGIAEVYLWGGDGRIGVDEAAVYRRMYEVLTQ
jgi:hypothetical protein